MEDDLDFSKMEDDLNFFKNERQPQYFQNGRPFFSPKLKTISKPKLILGLAKLSKIFMVYIIKYPG
jgi:hypothetical protein